MDKREKVKAYKQRQQRRYFLKFMAFLHGRNSPYPIDHEFEPDELRAVTPADIIKFIKQRKPFHKTLNGLEDYRAAIGNFMPDKKPRWNPETKTGNPAKSNELMEFFKTLKEEEKREQESQAEKLANLTAIEIKYESLLEKVNNQNHQFMKICDSFGSTIEQMKRVLDRNNAAFLNEMKNLKAGFVSPLANENSGENKNEETDGMKNIEKFSVKTSKNDETNLSTEQELEEAIHDEEIDASHEVALETQQTRKCPLMRNEWWYAHEDGIERRIPPSWTLPKCNLRALYLLWHCGDKANCVSPMKYFTPKDIVSNRGKTLLCEVRILIRDIDEEATCSGSAPKKYMSEAEALHCYDMGVKGVKINSHSPEGKLRDIERLAWTTVLSYRTRAAVRTTSSNKDASYVFEGTNNSDKLSSIKKTEETPGVLEESNVKSNEEKSSEKDPNGLPKTKNTTASSEEKDGETSDDEHEKASKTNLADPSVWHQWWYVHPDGRKRRVPPSWTFIKCNIKSLYLLWHCGDNTHRICPMKRFTHDDIDFISTKTINIETIGALIREIDDAAEFAGCTLKQNMTTDEALTCFVYGVSGLNIKPFTPLGKARHIDSMSLAFVLRERPDLVTCNLSTRGRQQSPTKSTKSAEKLRPKKRKATAKNKITKTANRYTQNIVAGQIINGRDWWYPHEDGTMKMVPPTWTFPKGNVQRVYLYWHCGDEMNQIYPMKFFVNKDVEYTCKRARVFLHEIRHLVTLIDEEATRLGMAPKANMTPKEASICYAWGINGIKIPPRSQNGKLRDIESLSWQSVHCYLSRAKNESK